MDIHSRVPNTYTLLSSLPQDYIWYAVLDLKDAFSTDHLAPKTKISLHSNAVTLTKELMDNWCGPNSPQGFKNFPTIFNEALHEDLGEFDSLHPQIIILQDVDDLLIVVSTQKLCLKGKF